MYDDDAVDRCRRIQSLKARRLTLAEIRAALPNS
jgi:DNA-binding transcriptional MerR regulator